MSGGRLPTSDWYESLRLGRNRVRPFEKNELRRWEDTMEFDAAQLDPQIGQEKWVEYWRERAGCLEEWVCELLWKNQALRMALQKEQSQYRQHEETTSELSFLEIHQSLFIPDRTSFGVESSSLSLDASTESCPRKECAEVRDSVIRNAVINRFIRNSNN
jgi:hypothetical protein